MRKAKFRRRMVFDVTEEEHQVIKMEAAKRHVSMRLFVMQAIELRIIEEQKFEEEDVYMPRRTRSIK